MVHLVQLFLRCFVVVPSSHDLVLKWAETMVAARRNGRRIETANAWIAATALLYDVPLLTHNKTDYLGVPGLQLSLTFAVDDGFPPFWGGFVAQLLARQ